MGLVVLFFQCFVFLNKQAPKKNKKDKSGKGITKHNLIEDHGNRSNDNDNVLLVHNGERKHSATFKRHDDSELVKTQKWLDEINQSFDTAVDKLKVDYKKHHKRALKSNTNLCYDAIITFGDLKGTLSRSEIDDLSPKKLDEAVINYCRNLCKENGIDKSSFNLVKHLDESMPHYHFSFLGYDFDKHRMIRDAMHTYFLSQQQDKVAEAFQAQGLDIQRGIKKDERIDEYLKNHNLTRDDYNNFSQKQKNQINREANTKNKSLKELNSTLKEDIKDKNQTLDKKEQRVAELKKQESEINENLDTKAEFLSLLEKMDTKKLNEEKQRFQDDPILKRLLTYAIRINNKNANQTKNLTLLKKTIDKLESQVDKYNDILNRCRGYELELQRKAELMEEILALQGLENKELEQLMEHLKAQKEAGINNKLLTEINKISKRKYGYDDALSL